MKDYFSLFLLRNSLAAKMKKNISNFCNGSGSTSTLNQTRYVVDPHQLSSQISPSIVSSCSPDRQYSGDTGHHTLEEMILRLELEEEAAKKAKLREESSRRMSCVNNSDILRSARNALNQYPRFSLDGRDAMYRSSFRNNGGGIGRKSVCCSYGQGLNLERSLGLPPTLAGEKVVWCKPGVVAKLMGLEAVPVPIGGGRTTDDRRHRADKGRKEEFMRYERQRRLNKKMGARNQQRWRSDYYEMEPGTGDHRWEMR